MNEIINKVIQATGLPEDKAAIAVEVVVGCLKDKLPAPVSAQIQGLLAGGASAQAGDSLGDVSKGLGGMFGKP